MKETEAGETENHCEDYVKRIHIRGIVKENGIAVAKFPADSTLPEVLRSQLELDRAGPRAQAGGLEDKIDAIVTRIDHAARRGELFVPRVVVARERLPLPLRVL